MATNRPAVINRNETVRAVTLQDINKVCAIVKNESFSGYKIFQKLSDMAEFAQTSEAYKIGEKHFLQNNAPPLILISNQDADSTAGYALLKDVNNIDTDPIIAISDGSFNIRIDSTAYDIQGLDFTSATDIESIVSVVSASLTGVIATIDDDSRIRITSLNTGSSSIVESPTPSSQGGTDVSVFISDANDQVVPGADGQTLLARLQKMKAQAIPAFAVLVLDQDYIDSDEVKSCFSFLQNELYLTFLGNKDINFVEDVELSKISFFKTLEDRYDEVTIASMLLSADIGSKNAKFLKPIGIPAFDLDLGVDLTTLEELITKNVNIYTGVNENMDFEFFKEGTVSDGDYIDSMLGNVWINYQIYSFCYQILTSKKISIFNPKDITLLNANLAKIMYKAVENGIIAVVDDQGLADTWKISIKKGRSAKYIDIAYSYLDGSSANFITNTITREVA